MNSTRKRKKSSCLAAFSNVCVAIACSGSLTPLLLACSFSCWLPPSFSLCPFSPSPLVIVVLQKAGGGVFTEKEVRPIRGREHLCAVSQKLLTVLHETQPRSNSPLSLPPACLFACCFYLLLYLSSFLCSFCFVYALSWPVPSFSRCETCVFDSFFCRLAARAGWRSCQLVYDILYTGLA